MKKSVIFAALMLLMVAGIGTAQALNIVVVNLAKAVEQSPQYQATQKALEAEYERQTKGLVADQKKIKQLEDKLEKNRDVMSAAEAKRQEQDIRSRRRKLNYDLQEAKDDFNMRAGEERRKLVRQIMEVVREVGKAEKIDIILADGVVYASEAMDITDKVIQRLKDKSKGK